MGRRVAVVWHASFAIIAAALYFFFVIPRWYELLGETSHSLGTGLRILCGAIVGLAALPVFFTRARTRAPELRTPQLALSILSWSIAAHLLAAVLIVGIAISEIWLTLDKYGPWLFGGYGAAAAIALLGFAGLYLSFIAELPPAEPKKVKPKKVKKDRGKKGKGRGSAEMPDPAEGETEAETDTETEADGAAAETAAANQDGATTHGASTNDAVDDTAEDLPDVPEHAAVPHVDAPAVETDDADAESEPKNDVLLNRRPRGKTSHRRVTRSRSVSAKD